MTITVTDNSAESRYELHTDGQLAAFVVYRLDGNVTDMIHTETLAGFAGQGFAGQLVAGALADVRRLGRHVRPTCPYVRGYLDKHPDQRDLVPDDLRARLFGETPT